MCVTLRTRGYLDLSDGALALVRGVLRIRRLPGPECLPPTPPPVCQRSTQGKQAPGEHELPAGSSTARLPAPDRAAH